MKKVVCLAIIVFCLVGCQKEDAFIMPISTSDIIIEYIEQSKGYNATTIIKDKMLKNKLIDKIKEDKYQKGDTKDITLNDKITLIQDDVEVELYPLGYLKNDSTVYRSKNSESSYALANQIINDQSFEIKVYVKKVNDNKYLIKTLVGYNRYNQLDTFDNVEIKLSANYNFTSGEEDKQAIDDFKKSPGLDDQYERTTIEIAAIQDVSTLDSLLKTIENQMIKMVYIKDTKVVMEREVSLEGLTKVIE